MALIGSDCVGAIQIVEQIPHRLDKIIESKVVSEAEIAHTLRSYQTSPLGMDKEDEFRISIAGAEKQPFYITKMNRINHLDLHQQLTYLNYQLDICPIKGLI